jgi:hypothetical protein
MQSGSSESSSAQNQILHKRPVVQPDSYLRPPDPPQTVRTIHPVVQAPFLVLPAYDYDPSADMWGVHYASLNDMLPVGPCR